LRNPGRRTAKSLMRCASTNGTLYPSTQ
jgi:hypothetical protein